MDGSGSKRSAARAAWLILLSAWAWAGCRFVEEPKSHMARLGRDGDCMGARCACRPATTDPVAAGGGSLVWPDSAWDGIEKAQSTAVAAGKDDEQDEDATFGPKAASWPPAKPLPIKALLRASCGDLESDRLFLFPLRPVARKPMRAVYASPSAQAVRFALVRGGRVQVQQPDETWGWKPQGSLADITIRRPGRYRLFVLGREGPIACREIDVARRTVRPLPVPWATFSGVWQVRRQWTPQMEDLFSLFIGHLFRVPAGEVRSWPRLVVVLRNPRRNLLHDALGWGEDDGDARGQVRIAADCADAPYALRAYFSWKMGLPFGLHRCTRGNARTGPKCEEVLSSLTDYFDKVHNPVERFNRFVWLDVTSQVHSGNTRSRPEKDDTDLYPLALEPSVIRPGVLFVDAGGHVITVTEVRPQTGDRIGEIYGVDAHPDQSVTRKRFGPGLFVFSGRVPTDGFKAFRPVLVRDGALTFLPNRILTRPWLPYSKEQAKLAASKFYRRIIKLVNPRPMDPFVVLTAKVEDFYQATMERVEAVRMGIDFMKTRGWDPIAMPKGAAIFQTTGPWEAYSTPARDMRYLKVIDDLLHFPAQVLEERELYALPRDKTPVQTAHELTQRLSELLTHKKFAYERSDGTKWTLSLADVVARRKGLEVAYNPNDCPEIRWAAPYGSQERATCNRRAPQTQRDRMDMVRQWFANRMRPGR